MRVGILTGGFDPVTAGHLALFKDAKRKVDILIVFANSDVWLSRKKGKPFMDQEHRLKILNEMESIDRALPLTDEEDSDDTSIEAIRITSRMYPGSDLVFMNGGDRGKDNIPEMGMSNPCPNLTFEFGIGGTNKDYSSSWLLRDWKEDLTKRRWGHYKVLSDGENSKVKELYLEPGKSISLQRHAHRREHWIIVTGNAEIILGEETIVGIPGVHVFVEKGQLHKMTNAGDDMLMVVEVQTGDYFGEDDIIRYEEIEEEG